jgi:lipopolysaccharide transport system ATP-binding protein
MGEVSKEGRTVLFVSHNMAAINRLCHRSIWLDEGAIREKGDTSTVVASYLSLGAELEGQRRWDNQDNSPGNDMIRLLMVRLINSQGEVMSNIDVRHPFFIEIEYVLLQSVSGIQVGFSISTYDGVIVFVAGDNEDSRWIGKVKKPGKYKSKCKIPGLLFNSGVYYLSVASDLRNAEILFSQENVIRFQVEQTKIPAHSPSKPAGVICPFLEWQIEKVE